MQRANVSRAQIDAPRELSRIHEKSSRSKRNGRLREKPAARPMMLAM
jgi:hypothetical protein